MESFRINESKVNLNDVSLLNDGIESTKQDDSVTDSVVDDIRQAESQQGERQFGSDFTYQGSNAVGISSIILKLIEVNE